MRMKHYRKIKGITIACLVSMVSVFSPMLEHVAAEESGVIVLPNNVMLIQKDETQNISLSIQGNTGDTMTAYARSTTGRKLSINITNIDDRVNLYAGYDDAASAKVSNNTVTISDNTSGSGWSVYTDPSYMDGNHSSAAIKALYNDDLHFNVIAGHSDEGEVSGNRIIITGGSINGNIIAAETSNKVEVSPGTAAVVPVSTIIGKIPERLHDNTIYLTGKPDLANASLYGAVLLNHELDDSNITTEPVIGTNNALNINTKEVEVANLGGFNDINFYLDSSVKDTDAIIMVRKSSSIENANLMAYIAGDNTLGVNDMVLLIEDDSENFDVIKGGESASYAKYTENVTGAYELRMGQLLKVYDMDDVALFITGKSVRPQVENMLMVPKIQLVNRSGDLLAGDGYRQAEMAAGRDEYKPFFAGSYNSMHHKTGDGLDLDSENLLLGFARELQYKNGDRMVIAPFAEYGQGRFDATSLGNVHGNGHLKSYGAGLLLRNIKGNGVYTEGSLRYGSVDGSYHSDDLLVFNRYVSENFHSRSRYLGAHIGMGRLLKTSYGSVDYYGKFFYSGLTSDDVHLPTGEDYMFNPVRSERLRLGFRIDRQDINENNWYYGAAWEYEFSGRSSGSWQGLSLPEPSYRGGSIMLEAGYRFRPDKSNDRLYMDMGLTGWYGRQRGIQFKTGVNWTF